MKFKVAILGATGIVGQRFIELLVNHPWFEIEAIAASRNSVGKKFDEVVNWTSKNSIPEEIATKRVMSCSLEEIQKEHSIDLVFSALPSSVALELEGEFAREYPVISKTSAYRLNPIVPLLIPEVNPEHLEMIKIQQKEKGWKGFICTDPNCSTIQLALSLKPLMPLGLSKVIISTMQSVSGAGYPGVSSIDIINNVVPFISGEEAKIETETKKILGTVLMSEISNANLQISASCNRVSVLEGHLETVFIKVAESITYDEIYNAFTNFTGEPQRLNLPSAPLHPIIIRNEPDRPQPRLDTSISNGMSVVIGRLREDPILSFKYVCLGNNTIRGAAGAGILSAELLVKKGYIT
ncbi:MAG: aspartate-semialdehyde dehydrogenase [Candidatus Heimdallarchaeota archaeon]|nr:aspartate-semialdehyde dehydrogenase [Candidatus Heimdallarchaeota archaeon]